MSAEITLPDAGIPDTDSPAEPSAVAPAARSWMDRTLPLLAAFFAVGSVAFAVAWMTVHSRPADEQVPAAVRSRVVLSRWLDDGYFHYFGLVVRNPTAVEIYKSGTGAYMISGFVAEKLFSAVTGRRSWRLIAFHNELVSLVLAALAALLAFRVATRFCLDRRLSFAIGSSVVLVVFTFPDNLMLYFEMGAQPFALLFALVWLLIEERHGDDPTTTATLAQAAAAFLVTFMELLVGLAFISALAATRLALRGKAHSWRRFALVAVIPTFAALGVYGLQVEAASHRFPQAPMSGSGLMFRSGLDGDATYYDDHLGIATRRDVARANWPANRADLFRWKWVFILGSMATLGVTVAYVKARAPRFALEALAALTGIWLLYGAVFSQAFVIHPYLYDVLLFTPMALALFAFAPALVEALTGRTGVAVLLVIFAAIWYSFFQLRLYALRYPTYKPPVVAHPS